MTARVRRRSARHGFTLLELLTTLAVLAILGGVALPALRDAVYRADAAKVASDMAAVRSALYQYREANGELPRTARWGRVPPELAPNLEGVPFAYKDLEYRLVTRERRGRVEFRVRYPRHSPIGAALQRFRREGTDAGSVTWTARQTVWRLVEGGR